MTPPVISASDRALLTAWQPQLARWARRFGREHLREECEQEACIALFSLAKQHDVKAEDFGVKLYLEVRSAVTRLVRAIAYPVRYSEHAEAAPLRGDLPVEYLAKSFDGQERVAETHQLPSSRSTAPADTPSPETPDTAVARAQASRRVHERVTELMHFMSDLDAAVTAEFVLNDQPPREAVAAAQLGVTTEEIGASKRRVDRLVRKGVPEEFADLISEE